MPWMKITGVRVMTAGIATSGSLTGAVGGCATTDGPAAPNAIHTATNDKVMTNKVRFMASSFLTEAEWGTFATISREFQQDEESDQPEGTCENEVEPVAERVVARFPGRSRLFQRDVGQQS